MSITQDTEVDNSEYDLANDKTGLDEIQKAMEEIKKLENQEQQEVIEETEETPIEEEEVEEAETAEETPIKKEKKEDKLWKVKKDKYRALAEKEALMKENLQQKQMINELLNSGTYHFGKSALGDLEKAKENKKKAIEDGDIDALIESDIALNKALNVVNDLEKWSYSDKQNKPTVEATKLEPQEYEPNLVEQEIAADWLDTHNYLQPTSSDYNPKLANQVADFINYLDTNLAKTGQRDAYYSEEYFRTIENYIDDIQSKSQKVAKKIESAAHVGSVRNSYTGTANGKGNGSVQQTTLTLDERKMCANAGISEKEWAKYKLEQLQESKRGR